MSRRGIYEIEWQGWRELREQRTGGTVEVYDVEDVGRAAMGIEFNACARDVDLAFGEGNGYIEGSTGKNGNDDGWEVHPVR